MLTGKEEKRKFQFLPFYLIRLCFLSILYFGFFWKWQPQVQEGKEDSWGGGEIKARGKKDLCLGGFFPAHGGEVWEGERSKVHNKVITGRNVLILRNYKAMLCNVVGLAVFFNSLLLIHYHIVS